MIVIGVWMWLGCASGTKPAPTPQGELTPPPIPGTSAAADDACMKDCMRSKMAISVSADLIEEQCAQQCSNTQGESLGDPNPEQQPSLKRSGAQ